LKTVTVQSIIQNAASRAGLDGSSIDSLPTTTKTIMVDNLGMHLRDAWEFYDWPDLTRTEERTTQTGVDEDIYIDLEQTGSPTPTAIGDVFAVYQDNPNTHAAPREIAFSLDLDKIRLPSDCPDTVYVKFRLPSPDISPVLATALAQTVPQILADYIKVLPHRRPLDGGRTARQSAGHVWQGRAVAGQGDREIYLPTAPSPPMDRASFAILTN
jgi:hypothetical protein